VRSPLRAALALVLCGLLLSAASCEITVDGDADPTATGAAKLNDGGNAGDDGSNSVAELNTLDVADWHSMSGYSRSKFPHWRSQGEECDTRETVLKRDAESSKTGEDCKVVSGTWISAYDGKEVTEPQDLDIDHMVPLANAWRTGAWDWSNEQRAEFANDLTRPQLIAVTATTNRSKGDQDPSEWRPPRESYWCEYAQDWVTVKVHWKLSVTAAEKAALREMLATC
jgi:hypothetical protein